jgi:hypothetical protein
LLCGSIFFSGLYSYATNEIGVGDIIYAPQRQESTINTPSKIPAHTLSIYTIQQQLILTNLVETLPQQGSVLPHLQKIDQLIHTDILQNMEISNNKGTTLQQYLQECD